MDFPESHGFAEDNERKANSCKLLGLRLGNTYDSLSILHTIDLVERWTQSKEHYIPVL